MTGRRRSRRLPGWWRLLALAVLCVFVLLYLLGYYLGPGKRWRNSAGPVEEGIEFDN